MNKPKPATELGEAQTRWQDVDAYLQSKLPPKHRGKRVRRHKLLYAVWRTGVLRTGRAPFEATFHRFPMGPVCKELAASYSHDGNAENLKETRHSDEVIKTLAGAMAPELEARSHSYPEYSADELGTKITVRQIRRLARSFVQQIRIPKDGKPCRHSRHCGADSCLKQVVRYLEMLCSQDSELFCWPSVADIQKHTKRRDGGRPYERTEVYFCRKFILEIRMFVRAQKLRSGIVRNGWMMIPHDRLAIGDASYCVWGKPQVSTSLSTSKQASVNTSVNTDPKSVNVSVNISDEKCQHAHNYNQLDISDLQETNPETHTPNQGESGYSQEESGVNQVETKAQAQNAQGKGNNKTNGSLRSSRTYDYEKPADKNGMTRRGLTVGDALRSVRGRGTSAEELILGLSDGEFNPNALRNYEHTDELVSACQRAIDDMSEEEFRGRVTLAEVMGMAMERLREDYNYDAPRGWLPIIKRLKSGGELNFLKVSAKARVPKSGRKFLMRPAIAMRWASQRTGFSCLMLSVCGQGRCCSDAIKFASATIRDASHQVRQEREVAHPPAIFLDTGFLALRYGEPRRRSHD